MTFALTVDAHIFREHLNKIASNYKTEGATLIPVVKGNGYGFGRETLIREANLIGAAQIAVANVWELSSALTQTSGQVLVLEPFNPVDRLAVAQWELSLHKDADRVTAILSTNSMAEAQSVGIKKVLLDGATSMHRFGMARHEMATLIRDNTSQVEISGLSLHSPIADPVVTHFAALEMTAGINTQITSNRVLEILSWLASYQAIARENSLALKVSLSHLTSNDIKTIKLAYPDFELDIRTGTQLWLGCPKALHATGDVLAIHEITKSTHVGYRQVESANNQRLVVVSGGTAHGVALAAPADRSTLRKKGIALAEGINEVRGKVRSPFTKGAESFVFAEPPHMHVSLLWTNSLSINVGDKLDCIVRNTTATFDVVVGL